MYVRLGVPCVERCQVLRRARTLQGLTPFILHFGVGSPTPEVVLGRRSLGSRYRNVTRRRLSEFKSRRRSCKMVVYNINSADLAILSSLVDDHRRYAA